MRTFVKWVLIIYFTCLALIYLARLLGQVQPLPSNMAMLHLSDCVLPCWIGIVPGKTKISEAHVLIARIYGKYPYTIRITGNNTFLITNQTNNEIISVRLDDLGTDRTENAIIHVIRIQPYTSDLPPRSPTIGDLYSTLDGSPQEIILSAGLNSPQSVLLFRDRRVHIFVGSPLCSQIAAQQPVSSLTLYDDMPAEYAWASKAESWHGFGRCYSFQPPN